jgi:hypothetical protein
MYAHVMPKYSSNFREHGINNNFSSSFSVFSYRS